MSEELIVRIKNLDWNKIQEELDEHGFAKLPQILSINECNTLMSLYDIDSFFRTSINMSRYRFGKGEYKYFSYPLPEIVSSLRSGFYVELMKTANRWNEYLKKPTVYPDTLEEFLMINKEHQQSRPTPLLLKYEEGGYNCLHQDLYGDIFFPFQVLFVLNQREAHYFGGESLLVEQRPRAQSRGHVITIDQGCALIFPTNYRPVKGKNGYYKCNVKHGISTLFSGKRYGLGIIFHDSK